MNEYFENLDEKIKEYFKVLSEGMPDFLYDYINTPAMQRIGKIGCGCGTDYTKIFNNKFFYSNLDHSIGVALIIWNFTKDKRQTIAGLFHDISTPVFKHCIDFMNGDHETQESTEELTTYMIKNSKEIMELLERDNIKVNEVDDYHIYPIADNDTPKLSADRLEYTFTNGLYFKKVWDVQKIKKIYSNIEIQINEDGIAINHTNQENNEVARTVMDEEGFRIINKGGNELADIGAQGAHFANLTIDGIFRHYPTVQIIDRQPNWNADYYVAKIATGDGTGRDEENKADSLQTVFGYMKSQGCMFFNKLTINIEAGVRIREKIVLRDFH